MSGTPIGRGHGRSGRAVTVFWPSPVGFPGNMIFPPGNIVPGRSGKRHDLHNNDHHSSWVRLRESWKKAADHRPPEKIKRAGARNFSALKWYSARQNHETRAPPCLGRKSFLCRKLRAQTAELYFFTKIEKSVKLCLGAGFVTNARFLKMVIYQFRGASRG